ncbi:MAG: hypothetical protein WCF57_08300 [Pyrinomonadaceae bacterium]
MAQCQGKNSAKGEPSSGAQSNTMDDKDQQEAARFDCLPEDTTLKDVVTYKGDASKNVTVRDKLIALKAKCENGKLVDARRKEIRFFRIQCWGNPPADYRERQQRQQDELKELEKKYTVIVMGCNRFIE